MFANGAVDWAKDSSDVVLAQYLSLYLFFLQIFYGVLDELSLACLLGWVDVSFGLGPEV